jgi:5'-deoxynucleotidase YfbR-like HD superfamily hydrolase
MTDKGSTRVDSAARAARAWQRMLSGRRLDLLDPSPKDIEIEDIAHGLARVARWNGQTVGDHAFSVAQHALLVEEIATVMQPDLTRRWQLAALLHDAPEYVIGDLISPFKAAIGLDYKAFENKLLEAIYRRFGLPPSLPDRITMAIKAADRIAAFWATQLAGFTDTEANRYFACRRRAGHPAPAPGRARSAPVATAQAEFWRGFTAVAGVAAPPLFRHMKVPTGVQPTPLNEDQCNKEKEPSSMMGSA